MSSTRTVTEAPLVLRLVVRPAGRDLVGRMIAILQAGAGQADPLSAQLLRWGARASVPGNRAALWERVKELRQILCNPLDGAPLREPVLVGARVWEQWMWNEFLALEPTQGAECRVHAFATAMIDWLNSLPPQSGTAARELIVETPYLKPYEGEDPSFRCQEYRNLIRNAVLKEHLTGTQQRMEGLVAKARAVQEGTDFDPVADLRAHIAAMERAYAEAQASTERVLADGMAALDLTSRRLDETQEQLSAAEGAIAEAARRAQAAERQAGDTGLLLQTTEHDLAATRREAERRLDDADRRLEAARSDAAERAARAAAEAAALSARISAAERRANDLQGQISSLQQQVDDGDSGCAIM